MLLVMIQAEIKQTVRRFPSVKCVIVEITVPHYLTLARWNTSWGQSHCIQEAACNYDFELPKLLYMLARKCCNVFWMAVAHNGH